MFSLRLRHTFRIARATTPGRRWYQVQLQKSPTASAQHVNQNKVTAHSQHVGIDELAKRGQHEEVIKKFRAMRLSDVQPDFQCYKNVFHSCGKAGEWKFAEELISKCRNPSPDWFVGMMQACKRANTPESMLAARKLLEKDFFKIPPSERSEDMILHKMTTPALTAMLTMLCSQPDGAQLGMDLWERFEKHIQWDLQACGQMLRLLAFTDPPPEEKLGFANQWAWAVLFVSRMLDRGLQLDGGCVLCHACILVHNNKHMSALMMFQDCESNIELPPNTTAQAMTRCAQKGVNGARVATKMWTIYCQKLPKGEKAAVQVYRAICTAQRSGNFELGIKLLFHEKAPWSYKYRHQPELNTPQEQEIGQYAYNAALVAMAGICELHPQSAAIPVLGKRARALIQEMPESWRSIETYRAIADVLVHGDDLLVEEDGDQGVWYFSTVPWLYKTKYILKRVDKQLLAEGQIAVNVIDLHGTSASLARCIIEHQLRYNIDAVGFIVGTGKSHNKTRDEMILPGVVEYCAQKHGRKFVYDPTTEDSQAGTFIIGAAR